MRVALLTGVERMVATFRALGLREGFNVAWAARWRDMTALLADGAADVAVFHCPIPCPVAFRHCGDLAGSAGVPFLIVGGDPNPAVHAEAVRRGAVAYLLDPPAEDAMVQGLRAGLAARKGSRPRGLRPQADWVRLGPGLAVHPGSRELWDRGLRVPLSVREFRILMALLERRGEVVALEELVARAWSEFPRDAARRRRDLYVYVRSLRRKLGDDPAAPRLVLNKYGRGYMLASSLHEPARVLTAPEDCCGRPAGSQRVGGGKGVGQVL